jgi:serine/threonine-protein kinase HipA
MSSLPVYYEQRLVGMIEVGANGPSFVYEPLWLSTRGAFPLSIMMPLSPRPFSATVFLPWATNLLPEGTQLKTVSAMLGAAPEDTIAILSQIGRDTAGALSIGKPGSADPGDWRVIKTDKALERILEDLPKKPFLAGDDGVSMSLAGVQSKLGVALNDQGRLCIPLNGAPSTHILKPDAKDRLFGSVQNEALCLTLARRCGLNAPKVTTGKAGARSYFLIERYDRFKQGDRWRRLHQEDFCQALGIPPASKYESNQTGIKGPSFADLFALTRTTSAPDIVSLLDYAIFNILVCNTDAHGKNYSLMITGRGFRLAPIYDVMCAAAWDGITKNLAMKIADKTNGKHLKRRHWERLAAECGLSRPGTVARVEMLANKVMKELDAAVGDVEAMPAGTHAMLPLFKGAIEQRVRAILAGLLELAGPNQASTDIPIKTAANKPKPKASMTPKTEVAATPTRKRKKPASA